MYNTFGTIKGSEKPNEYVLLSAHFDSWDGSQGATDNGTGTITMMEAMRILKTAYPHPKRTIMVGHWPGEEQGLNRLARVRVRPSGDRARRFRRGSIRTTARGASRARRASGLPNAGEHMQAWLAKLPQEFQAADSLQRRRRAGDGRHRQRVVRLLRRAGRSDSARSSWDYGTYTHHTNRDSFDKIVFDDLKGNATIVAMLAYLASEDPTFITRERADLQRPAAADVAAAAVARRRAERTRRRSQRCGCRRRPGGGRWRPRQRDIDEKGWANDLPEDAALHRTTRRA